MTIIPVILSGGAGTRLWPLSRAARPKQFLRFGSEHSLFQESVLRCRSGLFDPQPVVVGGYDHRFLLAEDLVDIGVEADILLEPVARNSCAAVAAGCLCALARSPDAVVLALPADHRVGDVDGFTAAVEEAAGAAEAGYLVTFGIRPEHATSAYGYILAGEERLGRAAPVERFVEKPSKEVAERYIAEGYLWNSGNFLFRADAFLDELEKLAPAVLQAVMQAVEAADRDFDFVRLDGEAFRHAPSLAVDHAVMERTDRAAVLPVDYAWSDIGSWNVVADVLEKDVEGNAVVGEAALLQSRNNLVHCDGMFAGLVGVEDMMVVATRDSLLVAPKTSAEDVKALVENMRARGHSNADTAPLVFRPWGNFERLDLDEDYQVKRIVVKPGGVLSLQKHARRAEHWVVVRGRAEVTVDASVRELCAGQSAYVPLGSVHRLANRGHEPVVLIEVQTGDYFGEDDIMRFEDKYNRVPDGETT